MSVDSSRAKPLPTAYVMNMFYTGLGIARSLGERGVPVAGLTSQHGVAGNFTRYAKTVFCPDSRSHPEELLAFLVDLGRAGKGGVLFPTRDDDVAFLDRYRNELAPYFRLVIPPHEPLEAALSKWETYVWAKRCGVPTPESWLLESEDDLRRVLPEVRYPCVLKPLSSHLWRLGRNWQIVGARKAIGLNSEAELVAEYAAIRCADSRAILQVMVPGGDDALIIAACYLDRDSRLVAGFNTQKLLQIPEGFGTGCIVASADAPELFPRTEQLLRAMGYQGIAEVEYKWDATRREHLLIEINPRPWDQHRIGAYCGVDVIYAAYCEHAGLPLPAAAKPVRSCKWIAEDTFARTVMQMAWRRDPRLRDLFRLARGKRIFAVWSIKDPLPLLAYAITRFIPSLVGDLWCRFVGAWKRENRAPQRKDAMYVGDLAKRKNAG